MNTVERQVHGYRQGHQLLAASVRLPKEDQSTIDRLSDVAGPLRPRERFEPYLTAYPLPSRDKYVLARTWQDLTVTRAGCVRTVSLIIDITEWSAAESILPYLDLLKLDYLPTDGDATAAPLPAATDRPLPPTTHFEGSELLEALFLEDSVPVVAFDVSDPEIVATRLLTALWPAMRREFALSTFALSPRKVGGRDFDLVFAPKDARSKFADWAGRRIDGGAPVSARHRWTSSIVDRVFQGPRPRLLTSDEIGLVGAEGSLVDKAAALRIALLWDELLAKLDTTPTAALGLLDIANSGKVREASALKALEPSLGQAIRSAAVSLPDDEAWGFLGAITRKMHGRSMVEGSAAVRSSIGKLAQRSPEGAIALVSQSDERGIVAPLVPIIADGIGNGLSPRAVRALLSAPAPVLGALVSSSGHLAASVADDRDLIERLGVVLPELDQGTADAVSGEMLPLLLHDWQLPAAGPLFARLDANQLAAEVTHLGLAGGLDAPGLVRHCISFARGLGAKSAVLTALAGLPDTGSRNELLREAIDPSNDDSVWLVRQSGLNGDVIADLLVDLLRRADDRQLGSIMDDSRVSERAVTAAERRAPDLLRRFMMIDSLPLEAFVSVALRVFDTTDGKDRVQLARRALERTLGGHFGGDELGFVTAMLSAVGDELDGAWAARLGVSRTVPANVAGRNLKAFRKATQPARLRVVWSVNEVAEVLRGRQAFDLDASAAEACAHILFEAEKVTPRAAVLAAGHLLPMLMRQPRDPVSLIVAAAFPMIYRELRKKDEVPDLLKFIPFFDWDRCKAARQELVTAFMSSAWAPGDLALTACRCDDIGRILRKTAKTNGGEGYLSRVVGDLARLPDGCRVTIQKAVAAIREDGTSKYDWRD